MRKTLLIIAVIAISGCVHIPKESAMLSAELGSSIAEARRSHMALVSEYADQRRGRAEDFLRYRWTPRFISRLIKSIDFRAEVCNVKGDLDQAIVVQELVEAISKQVERKRRELMDAIDEIERDLRTGVSDHYRQAGRMNSAITSHLRTASEGSAFEKDVRDAVMRPLDKIVPISAANKKLDKMLDWVSE